MVRNAIVIALDFHGNLTDILGVTSDNVLGLLGLMTIDNRNDVVSRDCFSSDTVYITSRSGRHSGIWMESRTGHFKCSRLTSSRGDSSAIFHPYVPDSGFGLIKGDSCSFQHTFVHEPKKRLQNSLKSF